MPYDSWMELTTGQWNDAVVCGELHSEESQALLDNNYFYMKGGSAKQRAGTWELRYQPLRNILKSRLTHHRKRNSKDGEALVFAESTPNGEYRRLPFSNEIVPLCGRTRVDIQSVSFAGFDIDGGSSINFAKDRLANLGLFSTLYTTHSHGKVIEADTQATVDKFRILFPLREPYQLDPNDADQHAERCLEWRERLYNFGANELGLELDESGSDVNRLFYSPRHKPDATNWFVGVFAGRGLSASDMPYASIAQFAPPPLGNGGKSHGPRSGSDRNLTFIGKRPILFDGFDLVDWRRDWGSRFLVREFFEACDWDFGSDNRATGEARVLCPNDHAHSTLNDDTGCWIKDGNGGDSFVIYCHHNSCSDMGTLDQLLELETYLGLPAQYEHFSDLLCDPQFYAFATEEKQEGPPNPERYRRWDPRNTLAQNAAVNGEEK